MGRRLSWQSRKRRRLRNCRQGRQPWKCRQGRRLRKCRQRLSRRTGRNRCSWQCRRGRTSDGGAAGERREGGECGDARRIAHLTSYLRYPFGFVKPRQSISYAGLASSTTLYLRSRVKGSVHRVRRMLGRTPIPVAGSRANRRPASAPSPVEPCGRSGYRPGGGAAGPALTAAPMWTTRRARAASASPLSPLSWSSVSSTSQGRRAATASGSRLAAR